MAKYADAEACELALETITDENKGVRSMQTVRGIYKDGHIEFTQKPAINQTQVSVLITFLTDEHEIDLRDRKIDEPNAADLRQRLMCFGADWSQADMNAYDAL